MGAGALLSRLLGLARRPALGRHLLLDLHDCPRRLLQAPTFLEDTVAAAVHASRATLVEKVTHYFHPHGITIVAVLSESHLSLHTWPERSYAAADIFTCGQATTPEKASSCLIERLSPGTYRLRQVRRG
jgi:S-adenosylmethionine decarboxylase